MTRDGEDDPKTVLAKRVLRVRVGAIYALPFRLAHHIVALNDSARGSVEAAGWAHKVVQMTNGVDRKKLIRTEDRWKQARESNKVSAGDVVIAFVGYMVKHKGILDLLAAWQAAAGPHWRLWLVGPVDGFYRELDIDTANKVKSMAKCDDRITLWGKLDGDIVATLLAGVDVYVLPSYAEGMPNSLLEALVAGCTSVATDIPGIREIDRNDISLVPVGDVSALSEALTVAASLPKVRNASDAREDLGIDFVAEQLEGLYQRV